MSALPLVSAAKGDVAEVVVAARPSEELRIAHEEEVGIGDVQGQLLAPAIAAAERDVEAVAVGQPHRAVREIDGRLFVGETGPNGKGRRPIVLAADGIGVAVLVVQGQRGRDAAGGAADDADIAEPRPIVPLETEIDTGDRADGLGQADAQLFRCVEVGGHLLAQEGRRPRQ